MQPYTPVMRWKAGARKISIIFTFIDKTTVMKLRSIALLVAGCMLTATNLLHAQVMDKTGTKVNKKDGHYQFTTVKEIDVTDVKSQGSSGTCWVFSSMSFLESEVIHNGHGRQDLSEMYIVRQAYMLKARNYVRMMGKTNFGPGGEFHDVMNVIREFGMVPQAVYGTLDAKIEHNEMDEVLKAALDAIIKLPNGKLSAHWQDAIAGILDAYLGKVPETFEVEGKKYTPKSYAKEMGINPDDYVAFTSFTHHPFDKPCVVEVPDNWAWALAYNVPLKDMETIADAAINQGYPVAWASDVSEKGFSHKNGVAVVPAKNWEDMSADERTAIFDHPVPEKEITQALRQEGFDNLTTQDDHGMHFMGIVKDQNGNKYYTVKNSWGTESNENGGIFYVSMPFYLYKTTFIMVNKNTLPKDIAKRLGI